MKRLIRIAVVAVPLAGCTVAPVTTTGPRPQAASLPGPGAASERDGVGQGAELPADPAPGSTATRALLIQSQAEREAGDLGGAAATVERALTIAPDEALLWIELAEIRMAQGDGVLAQEMARKALTVTPPNSAVAIRARRLIAR
jgi:cytochrome c-type biogenesis protein CcmH/NrfG